MKRVLLVFGVLVLVGSGCGEVVGPEVDPGMDELLVTTEQGLLEELPGLGEAILIDFGPDSKVSKLFVQLRQAIISRPRIAERSRLDITITSLDGVDHFHGTASIPVTDIVPVDLEDRIVTGEVSWTIDDEPQVVGDVYTVCSTLHIELARRTWSGPERCQTFGPFF